MDLDVVDEKKQGAGSAEKNTTFIVGAQRSGMDCPATKRPPARNGGDEVMCGRYRKISGVSKGSNRYTSDASDVNVRHHQAHSHIEELP